MNYRTRDQDHDRNDSRREDGSRFERDGLSPRAQESSWRRPQSQEEYRGGYGSSRSNWDDDYGRGGPELQRGGWGGYEDSGNWNREERSGRGSTGNGQRSESRDGTWRDERHGESAPSGYFSDERGSRRTGSDESNWSQSYGNGGGTRSGYTGSNRGRGGYGYDSGRSSGATSGSGMRNETGWGGSYEGDYRSQGNAYGQSGTSQVQRADHRGKGPKGYKRSDERIKEDVSEALQNDGDVDASDIEVEVQDGMVTLSGEVQSRHEKRSAEDCCEEVPGVKDINNQLRVQSRNKQREDGASNRSTTSSTNTASSTNAGSQGQSSSKSQRIGSSNS